MITYDDLYESLRKEKYSEPLQNLPKKFLQDVAEYLDEKKAFVAKSEDIFSDLSLKNKKMLENAITSFRDLLRLRKRKILNLAFVASEVGISKKDFENMLGFEKDLFEEIARSLERADKDLSAEMNHESTSEMKNSLVRFIDEAAEFLDFEGNEIGPFKKGEIANLDREIVEILRKDGKVEIIDVD